MARKPTKLPIAYRITTPTSFDDLLMKLQRSLRGASDVDAASALIAVLVHYIQQLSGDELERARASMRIMLQTHKQPRIGSTIVIRMPD